MKRFLIYSVVAVIILSTAGIVWAEEGRPGRGGPWRRVRGWATLADANAPALCDANSARPRRMREKTRKGFEKRIAALECIKKTAGDEGADKTVAAVDKLITEAKERFGKRGERMRGMRKEMAGKAGRPRRGRGGGRRGGWRGCPRGGWDEDERRGPCGGWNKHDREGWRGRERGCGHCCRCCGWDAGRGGGWYGGRRGSLRGQWHQESHGGRRGGWREHSRGGWRGRRDKDEHEPRRPRDMWDDEY